MATLQCVVIVLWGLLACGDDKGTLWLYNIKSQLCHSCISGILSHSRVCFHSVFLLCNIILV